MKNGCIIKSIVGFFLVMGILAFTGGIYVMSKNFDLKFNGIKTTGVLIDYHYSESEQTVRDQSRYNQVDIYYYPVFRFAINGDSLTSKMNSGSEEAPLSPGDEAEILYSPSDPEYIGFPENVNNGIVVGILCMFLGLVGLIITILLAKNFRK